jgi:hypothetical protein
VATALFIYLVCASLAAIWCSLQTNIAYVPISNELLQKWKIERSNLIVISLLPKPISRSRRTTYDPLEVSVPQLPGLLRWIPPQSTVVFSHAVPLNRFEREVEEVLLRAAIDTVYLLDAREQLPLREFPGDHGQPLARHSGDPNQRG